MVLSLFSYFYYYHFLVPTNAPPKLTQVNVGSVRLQWDFSQVTSCGIYSNTILYEDGNRTRREVLIPASNQHVLTNLAPGVSYTFRVNADCVGSLAAYTNNVTDRLQEYPPSMPLNLEVKVTTAALEISWSPPAAPNGKLGNYLVTLNNISEEIGGLNYSFFDLKPMTTYTITIKAQTTAGYGPAASTVVTTDPTGMFGTS
ncbi:unnamed protein product [Dibothriocephalus latus]|uniref:Fibronectin type-III domain-containing protein n=1 Tax=Dibothriocephalus latus TaxID=60516 RepID=A0A3P7MMH1_DIBLA|nr:unnamed protein product [Dibothriocephalus latus]